MRGMERPPPSEPSAGRVTEEEFLALPEGLERLELIDGEVIPTPSPSPLHQRVVQLFHVELLAWERLHPPAMVGLAPLDVRLRPGRIVQPDLFVALGGYPLDRAPLDVVPDLVVEVLSPQATHDRLAKRLLYAQAGVKEYWLVDPYDRSVEQVIGLETIATAREVLVSRACPELRVDLRSLFGALTASAH